jgi:ABC-2 type transport system permease protein
VLVGRTASDVVYSVLSLAIMALIGLLVGWRIHTSPLEALVGFALLLAFAYAFSWVMAYVGLLVPSVEVIDNASFIVIFPLTFIANTVVPSENLLGVLRNAAPYTLIWIVAIVAVFAPLAVNRFRHHRQGWRCGPSATLSETSSGRSPF